MLQIDVWDPSDTPSVRESVSKSPWKIQIPLHQLFITSV